MTEIEQMLVEERKKPSFLHAEMVVELGERLTVECADAGITTKQLARHLKVTEAMAKCLLDDPETVDVEMIDAVLRYIERRKTTGRLRQGYMRAAPIQNPQLRPMRRLLEGTQVVGATAARAVGEKRPKAPQI